MVSTSTACCFGLASFLFGFLIASLLLIGIDNKYRPKNP